jgi:hypothetical protein
MIAPISSTSPIKITGISSSQTTFPSLISEYTYSLAKSFSSHQLDGMRRSVLVLETILPRWPEHCAWIEIARASAISKVGCSRLLCKSSMPQEKLRKVLLSLLLPETCMSLLGVRYANTRISSNQSLTRSDDTCNYYRNRFPSRDYSLKSPSILRTRQTRATSRQRTQYWKRS